MRHRLLVRKNDFVRVLLGAALALAIMPTALAWSAGDFTQSFCGGWDNGNAKPNNASSPIDKLSSASSDGNAFPMINCIGTQAGTYNWTVNHGSVNTDKASTSTQPQNLGTEHGQFVYTPSSGAAAQGHFNGRIWVYNQTQLNSCTNSSDDCSTGCTPTTAGVIYESFGRYHFKTAGSPATTGWYNTTVTQEMCGPTTTKCCFNADLSPNGAPPTP